jgi:hypothetical protein
VQCCEKREARSEKREARSEKAGSVSHMTMHELLFFLLKHWEFLSQKLIIRYVGVLIKPPARKEKKRKKPRAERFY